ncbi:SUMF1/EgtB/PvdO family nonheme iron enzyme [Candidatus Latescibacterota bacterium]
MICPECGKQTPDNLKQCVKCGANLEKKPPAPHTDSADKTILNIGSHDEKPDAQRSAPADRTQLTPESKNNKPSPPPTGPSDQSPPSPVGNEQMPATEEETLRAAISDRYEIIRKLGSGGMANVYLAREIALDREVAIKLLPQAYLRDEQFIARFKREAQVAANLEHPHVVRIYQISEEKNLCYFVMSYIPGGSLADQIKKRGALPIKDILQWGRDVCSALGYAHDHGVTHRDLKPDNIMLDKGKRAVVMDFGIARAAQGTSLTQTGSVIGTPQYMSPEQARGADIDTRSDIYSMGMVFYQMATASLPFKATDAASLMYMHVHETPEPPDVRNADVPPWLRDIILKCLAKNPVDRFSTAKELREALEQQIAPDLKVTPIPGKKKPAKKTGLLIGIAAVVLIAAAGAWFWRESELKKSEHARIEAQRKIEDRTVPEPSISQDDQLYQNAEMVNTRQAYTTYLEKYPDGAHIDEAEQKIAAIDEKEQALIREREQKQREADARREVERSQKEESRQADAIRQDDLAFQQAGMINTRQAYTTYLTSYPDGRHISEARAKIASLDEMDTKQKTAESEEQTRRDNEAFALTENTNTEESYSAYLISFPNGIHSSEARSRISAIKEHEAFGEKLRVALSSLSITMANIEAGSFQMGSNNGGGDEKPLRTVKVAGFKMSTTEVTQAQYNAIMGTNPSFHKLDENCPVENVTWKDALTFCNKLSEKIELEPCYDLSSGTCDFSKNGFRLPTEAEWEYACRGNSGSDYSTGNGESALSRAGWYAGNSGEKSHAVGQKTSNAFGLYDMHGNVWEWCNDWYSKKSYELDTTENPTGVESGSERVIRGGGWLDWPKDCRSAKRRNYKPDKNYSDIGFRIVRR